MPIRRLSRTMVLACAMLPLAGCDTFGLGSGEPAKPVARPLDYRQDDLSSAVFALDLPASLQPVSKATVASFSVTTATGMSRHVQATLVLADGDSVDGSLPPPAAGRTYYLLGFSDRDKKAMADLQKWYVALPPGSAPSTAFNITPKLCETAAVDPSVLSISVIPALPSTAAPLTPLIDTEPLTALLNGGQLPPCGSV